MSFIVIFDAEYTGPMLTQNAMIGLGAVLKRVYDNVTINSIDLILDLPKGRTWDDETKFFFSKTPKLDELRRSVEEGRGLDIKCAMDRFYEFLLKCYIMTNGNMVLGANRLDIDATWINYYLSLCGYNPLHLIFKQCDRYLIDTNSFHLGCSLMTHEKVKEFETIQGIRFNCGEAALRTLQIKERSTIKSSHNALDDAEHTAQTHALVLNKLTENYYSNITMQMRKYEKLNKNTKYNFYLIFERQRK